MCVKREREPGKKDVGNPGNLFGYTRRLEDAIQTDLVLLMYLCKGCSYNRYMKYVEATYLLYSQRNGCYSKKCI